MKKNILAFLLYYSGILWLKLLLIKIFGSSKLRILCYHRVLDAVTESFELDENVVDAKPSDFDVQMKFVSRHFNVMTLKELAEYKRKGRLPKNPLVITFDDGYEDNYTNAYPILKKYGLRATIFLVADYMGTNKLLWWDRVAHIIKKTNKREIEIILNGDKYHIDLSDKEKKRRAFDEIIMLLKTIDDSERREAIMTLGNALNVDVERNVTKNDCLSLEEIKEMSEYGIEFGSHTCTHPILTKLSDKMIREEIFLSKSRIEVMLSKPVVSFSYPNGTYDIKCRNVVREAGFHSACSYRYGTNNLSAMDMYELNRITMSIDKSRLVFKAALVFTQVMGIGAGSPVRKKSNWIIYRASRKSLELFLKINRAYSRRFKLAHKLLKLPLAGFPLARIICSKDIAFVKDNENIAAEQSYLMFQLVKDFVRNNSARLINEAGEMPLDFSLLAYERERGLNCYLISNGKIILFAKYMKYKKLEYMLEREFENIAYLNSKLNGNIKGSIPQLCLMERLNGHPVIFFNYIDGERMSEELTPLKSREHQKLEGNIFNALMWLTEFQRQTVTAKARLSSLEAGIKSLLLRYADMNADKKVIGFFTDEIVNKIREQGEIEIPLVCSHGDFFPNNILVDGENIRIVDWSDMEKEEIPTDDIFAFFLSFRLLVEGGNSSDTIMESFKFVFMERNWFSALVRECLEWYCAEMKLDKSLLRVLFPVYLLKQALLEAQGTLEDRIVSPQEWGNRLKYYVKSRENFVLNSLVLAK